MLVGVRVFFFIEYKRSNAREPASVLSFGFLFIGFFYLKNKKNDALGDLSILWDFPRPFSVLNSTFAHHPSKDRSAPG